MVNHVGGMFGIFFTDAESVTCYQDVMACDVERFKRFFHMMLTKVFTAPSAFEAGFMSVAHSMEDINNTIDAARRVFAKCNDFASPTGRGILLTALLSQQIDKIWRADQGRQQPRRIWNGNNTIRPHQSANTSSKPPTSAEITMCGIVRRKPIIRAICGAIKPTKLNGPMVIVAVAVRQAANSSSAIRVGVSAIPTARAVSPPSGKMVSQRRHSG